MPRLLPSASAAVAGPCAEFPGRPSLPYLGYLAHVGLSVPLRRMARETGRHASVFCRAMRRVELLREDPVLDRGLDRAAARLRGVGDASSLPFEEILTMTSTAIASSLTDGQIEREARRILRRLSETGAFLALSGGMDTAVVFRKGSTQTTRIATCPVSVVEAFRLRDWIAPAERGRIMRYTITAPGRHALSRLLEGDADRKRARAGEAEAVTTPQAIVGTREDMAEDGTLRTLRVNLAESPLALLARRRGKDGAPFLDPVELEAGERLREDFERARMGPRVTQNWDRLLTVHDGGGATGGDGLAGPQDARDRVGAAFGALGPGLSDIAMRCCCFLEGLETAERRMGWSARSGKVVLKIALARLADHYGLRRKGPHAA